MGFMQLQNTMNLHSSMCAASFSSSPSPSCSFNSKLLSFNLIDNYVNTRKNLGQETVVGYQRRSRRRKLGIFTVSSTSNVAPPALWDDWKPDQGSKAPSLSDIFWPSAGAFAAMAVLGKMDQILAPKGLSMTIAPFGAVCAVLFVTPSSPGARKYNIFMGQIGCAAIGVLAFSIFGPGWLARSAGLSAAIAFMIYTRSVHPPAASLPLLFVDGAKLHGLKFWYALFPGVAGCLLICLIQEVVCRFKDNIKF